jgi:hypothetical protein
MTLYQFVCISQDQGSPNESAFFWGTCYASYGFSGRYFELFSLFFVVVLLLPPERIISSGLFPFRISSGIVKLIDSW